MKPYTPASGSSGVQTNWKDVLASDSSYPANVYLTENIEYHPGKVGSARAGSGSDYYGSDGYPKDSYKTGACGPPEGSKAINSSSAYMTVLGVGGWAVWKFDSDWAIVNGPGDDFVTFSNHNVLYGNPDSSWNELAHVLVSADNINWYKPSNEVFTAHPNPGTSNSGFDWDSVRNLHGRNHSWANFRTEIGAEYLSSGKYQPLLDGNGRQIMISKYFSASDLRQSSPDLGGDRFDLSDFVHTEDGSSWPGGGRMRYLKLVDDPAVLDGQDWNVDWATGARLMSAMGINVEKIN